MCSTWRSSSARRRSTPCRRRPLLPYQDHGQARSRLELKISLPVETMRRLGSGHRHGASDQPAGARWRQVVLRLVHQPHRTTRARWRSCEPSEAAHSTAGREEARKLSRHSSSSRHRRAAQLRRGRIAGAPRVESIHHEGVPTPFARASLGAWESMVAAGLARAAEEHFAERVWEKDPNLWQPEPADQSEITDRLGWLTVTRPDARGVAASRSAAGHVRQAGFTHVVLLGMGGSSLAPEVLQRNLWQRCGAAGAAGPRLHRSRDDPHVENRSIYPNTLFMVASKSGGTIETLSQFKYFYAKVESRRPDRLRIPLHRHYRPWHQLAHLAQRLSVPGYLLESARHRRPLLGALILRAGAGGNHRAWTSRTGNQRRLHARCLPPAGGDVGEPRSLAGHGDGHPGAKGPGQGHAGDVSAGLTFGYWVEQLIAESTGKEGKGILPVEGEALGTPENYGNDRLFVYLRTDEGVDPAQDAALASLEIRGPAGSNAGARRHIQPWRRVLSAGSSRPR